MTAAVPLNEQINEAELHALGLGDQVARALQGKLKVAPEKIERLRARLAAAEAVTVTLKGMTPAKGSAA